MAAFVLIMCTFQDKMKIWKGVLVTINIMILILTLMKRISQITMIMNINNIVPKIDDFSGN